MIYEFNVAKDGRHLFATHERSCQGDSAAAENLKQILIAKFPEEEGYSISLSINPGVSYGVSLSQNVKEATNEIHGKLGAYRELKTLKTNIFTNLEALTELWDKAVEENKQIEFCGVVADYRVPEDDGESETMMLRELAKMNNVTYIINKLKKVLQ